MSTPIESKDLSDREVEVLRLLAAGLSNKEIAAQLSLSVNTVKVHLRNIFAKLGVQSRTEATLVAIQRGLVSVPQARPADEMLYAPAEVPRVVIEPPLPRWRRAALVILGLACAAGVAVTGLPNSAGAAAGGDAFSDRPADPILAASAAGDSAWVAAAPMAVPRTRLAVASYAGRLLVVGGDTPGGPTGAVEWYDPRTDEWTPGPDKPVPVSNVAAVPIGDRIVVPGGMTASGVPTSMVEIFDPQRGDWASAAPLPAPRMAYAAAPFDGNVYVMGGWDGSEYSSGVTVYNSETDTWAERAPMPSPRGFASAAALGDSIYVVGGYDGQLESNVCERYIPGQDRWEACPAMSVGRGGLALVTVGPGLYAIGGGWSGYLAFNESYVPGSRSWTALPTPFTGQWRGLGAATIDSEIITVGGWNGQYLAATERYSPYPFTIFVPAAPVAP